MSRIGFVAVVAVALLAGSGVTSAQEKVAEEDFPNQKPTIGDLLPDAVLYTPEGTPVKTAALRGHYTVLTFGCLT